MQAHRYAAIFPLLDDDDLADLAADIKRHGQRETVLTYEGQILDGRNRWRACELAGIPCRTEDAGVADDLEAIDLVMSLNLHRRHLATGQRAIAAARAKEMYEEDARGRMLAGVKQRPPSNPGANLPQGSADRAPRPRDIVAKQMNVSARSVQSASKVLSSGAPELVSAVDSGSITLHAAVKATALDHDDQREVVRRVKEKAAKNAHQAIREVQQERRIQSAPSVEPDDRWTLDCADALSWLSEPRGAACVVMDPPYGIDTHRTRQGGHDYADGEDYAIHLLREVVSKIPETCQPGAHVYCFTGYTHVQRFKEILGEHLEVQDNPIVWIKDNHTMCDFEAWYPNRYEMILFAKVPGARRPLAKCVPDVLTYARGRETTHSAEKPCDLLSLLIEQSTVPGELVIDPFAGSGSTGVSALRSGRRFAGCEVDESNAALARSRMGAE